MLVDICRSAPAEHYHSDSLLIPPIVHETHLDSERRSSDPSFPSLELGGVHLQIGHETAIRHAELDELIGDLE